MKLNTALYVSPIITEGKFDDVFIEDTSYELDRQNSILRINFEMYYYRNEQRIVLAKSSLGFEGMNDDLISTNRKTLFKYEDSEPQGLIQYFIDNNGSYPENAEIVDWGFPSFEDALTYLDGGSFQSPELFPINDFVRNWILNSVVMKGETIGQQFQFAG